PNNNVANLLRRLHRSVLKHHPSLVIVMIGTNDMINPPKRLSNSLYRKKLNTIVAKIKDNDADVLLLSLPYVDAEYLYARRRKKKYPVPPNKSIDAANKIIHQTAVDQQVMFLDINAVFNAHHSPDRTASGLIRNEENARVKDGVHPTPEGYQVMAESIARFLKEIDKSYPKIICFGDSITFGAYVKGEGSTKGET